MTPGAARKAALGCGGLLALAASGIALAIWMSIPPAPDPTSLPSTVAGPVSPRWTDAVDQARLIARERLAEEKLPGLSVAVAVDGEVVWAEGFRWADMDTETPVTPETLFRIGTVSTAFTAAAIGLLVDRGALDLDAPVDDLVPGLPTREGPVSTRQLMSHTAGLRDTGGEGGLFLSRHCDGDAARLELALSEPLSFRPGTRYLPSSHGWVVAGSVVAAAAAEPYDAFVARELLGPLGIEHTFADDPESPPPGLARFYFPRAAMNPRYGLQDAPEADLSCVLPAAGFLSTPTDMVRIGTALAGPGMLAPATVLDFQAPVIPESGAPTDQAPAWTVQALALGTHARETRVLGIGLGETVVHRPLSASAAAGQVSGGTACLVALPDYGIVVGVCTNVTGSGNVARIGVGVAGVFLDHREVPTR